MRRLNIFTWHVHGSYLMALGRTEHTWYMPITPERGEGYGGRGTLDLPANVQEVPLAAVPDLNLDLVLFQSARNYEEDQYRVLSAAQRQLPQIFLEHNAPHPAATESIHPVDDPNVLWCM